MVVRRALKSLEQDMEIDTASFKFSRDLGKPEVDEVTLCVLADHIAGCQVAMYDPCRMEFSYYLSSKEKGSLRRAPL